MLRVDGGGFARAAFPVVSRGFGGRLVVFFFVFECSIWENVEEIVEEAEGAQPGGVEGGGYAEEIDEAVHKRR